MKKKLLTAVILGCCSVLFHAQQGFVGINTEAPSATLDVASNPSDTSRPDAVLIPRLTRAQLAAKNSAYTVAQNGILIFVTALDGSAAGKTANVTAIGFYYYDGTATNTWIKAGGTSTAVTQVWQQLRTNVTDLPAATTSYTLQPTDYLVLFNGTSNMEVTLPDLTNTAADIGRTISIFNNSPTASATLQIINTTNVRASTFTLNQFRGTYFIWTGTLWVPPQIVGNSTI